MRARKVILLTAVAALSVGAMTVFDARSRWTLDNEADATVLEPVYAPPVESTQSVQLQGGESLTGLLTRAAITGRDLTTVLGAVNRRKSLRRLKPGTEITVRRLVGQSEARSIDLQFDSDTTIRLARADSGWVASLLITPIMLDTLSATGQIEAGRTVYDAVIYDEGSTLPPQDRPKLVVQLADIYAFKLDFTNEIQPGDRYTLVYEREARPDGSARRMSILAARLDVQGKRYDAMLFRGSYYDLDGASLRSGFKRYPVQFDRITSRFSSRRYHPILGIYRAHLGTDFGAPRGTPVRVTGDGTVVFAGRDGGYGNVVVVRHALGYTTRYAHLSRFGAGIRSGRRVQMDDVVGYVGSSGLATGPHLHYEIRRNGRAIDLRRAKLPSAPPLAEIHRDEFSGLVKHRLELLHEAVVGAGFARRIAQPAAPANGVN